MTISPYKASVLIAAACVCISVVIPGQALAAGVKARAWAVESTPANDDVTLTAVSCMSKKFCLAIGTFEFGSNGGQQAVAYRWDGVKWAASAAPADASALEGVACISTSYCIAVGGNLSSAAQAWSWSDGRWADQSTYNAASGVLWAVRCAGGTSCEAVGQRGDGLTNYPLAEYWNGSTWKDQSTAGAPAGTLHGVACEVDRALHSRRKQLHVEHRARDDAPRLPLVHADHPWPAGNWGRLPAEQCVVLPRRLHRRRQLRLGDDARGGLERHGVETSRPEEHRGSSGQ